MTQVTAPASLSTTAGDLPLEEVELHVGSRTWSILHTGAIVSREQEVDFLRGESGTRRPYGIVLWPSAIAIAHEVATRTMTGLRVLELGAGTGLPGIVAASLGAHVVQTDRQQLVLHVCKQNGIRNGVTSTDDPGAEVRHGSIVHRLADWTEWTDTARYDLILGADILYSEPLQPSLRHIFETNLAPGGTVLLADPYRDASIRMLERLEATGWRVTLDKWTVGITPPPRPVGLFALTRI